MGSGKIAINGKILQRTFSIIITVNVYARSYAFRQSIFVSRMLVWVLFTWRVAPCHVNLITAKWTIIGILNTQLIELVVMELISCFVNLIVNIFI